MFLSTAHQLIQDGSQNGSGQGTNPLTIGTIFYILRIQHSICATRNEIPAIMKDDMADLGCERSS